MGTPFSSIDVDETVRGPLISVVIATYQRWPLLQEAIASVLAQSFRDFELIVVDDGSTDGSGVRAAKAFPTVTVVCQANQERGAALNHGIRVARGRYVAFLDDDDVYEPWHLAQFAAAVQQGDGCDVLCSRAWLWDTATDRRRLLPAVRPATLWRDCLLGTLLPYQILLVRRRALIAVGGFPDARELAGAEDWILQLRLVGRYPVRSLSRPSVRIRSHAGRSMNDLRAISRSKDLAARMILDEGLLGYELDAAARRLVIAGTHRLVAGHHYAAGDMAEARARLRSLRAVVGPCRGVRWTSRLWLQTWMGPSGSSRARRVKNAVLFRSGGHDQGRAETPGGPRRGARRPVSFAEADESIAETLESLDGAVNYGDWIFTMMRPHLGERVLEIGAGYGRFTEKLLPGRHVTVSELSPRCIPVPRQGFGDLPNVELATTDIAELGQEAWFDSVVMVNVLEHIADDEAALRSLREVLRPEGRLLIFVPAFMQLYSDLDRRVGHYRRYRKTELERLVERVGFRVVDARYMNCVGAFAWWLLAKKLRLAPTKGWSTITYDRTVVPILCRLEPRWKPPFGRSILCVAQRVDRQ